jgi:hypothetical protein
MGTTKSFYLVLDHNGELKLRGRASTYSKKTTSGYVFTDKSRARIVASEEGDSVVEVNIDLTMHAPIFIREKKEE